MNNSHQESIPSRGGLWAGRILTGFVVLFLVVDACMKIVFVTQVRQASVQLGWPTEAVIPLGILLLTCALLYAYPRTAFLGAVLLTGYLGGAVATHWRIGNPLLTHTLFGVYVGVAMWAGLYLRDARLRKMVPWQK